MRLASHLARLPRMRTLEECEARRDVVHRPTRPASSASICIMGGASRNRGWVRMGCYWKRKRLS